MITIPILVLKRGLAVVLHEDVQSIFINGLECGRCVREVRLINYRYIGFLEARCM